MLFRVHFLFGLFAWLIVRTFVEMPLFVLGFVLLGAIFVDIDSYSSKVGRKFWFFSWFLKHRGFFHSLIACVLLSLIIGSFSLWFGFGFFVGYFSHLMIDCFTPMGVKVFWPFRFKVKGFVRSGSWVEDVLFVLLLVIDVIWIIWIII